jgi:hypothetical protein
MLVYLEPWIVQDGQVPELAAGDVLCEAGIGATCWTAEASSGTDVCAPAPGRDPDGFDTAHVILDGVIVWRSDTGTEGGWRDLSKAGVVRVDETLFLVRGVPDLVARPDHYRRRVIELPPVGDRARLHGCLSVLAAHESCVDDDGAATGQPDLRGDLLVNAVHWELRAMRRGECGDVVGVDTLDRMDCWRDESRGGAGYLLDLTPVG